MSDLDNKLIFEALKGDEGEKPKNYHPYNLNLDDDNYVPLSRTKFNELTMTMHELILDYALSNYSNWLAGPENKRLESDILRYTLTLSKKEENDLKKILEKYGRENIFFKSITELEGNNAVKTVFFHINENINERDYSKLLSLFVGSQYRQGKKRNKDFEKILGKTILFVRRDQFLDWTKPTTVSLYDDEFRTDIHVIPYNKKIIEDTISQIINEKPGDEVFDEGEKEQKLQNFRVRNRAVILQAKLYNRALHGGKLTCELCNLQPETKYYREGQVLSPEQTNALIEGHHKEGLEEGVVTVNDIECLCGNCHRYKHI